MPPSEALYRTIYNEVEQAIAPYSVYEFSPDEGTKYPFAWLDYERTPLSSNNDLMGEYHISIRLYGLLSDRSRLNEMNGKIHGSLLRLRNAYQYRLSLRTYDTTTLKENDNGTLLLHLTTKASFYWNEGER